MVRMRSRVRFPVVAPYTMNIRLVKPSLSNKADVEAFVDETLTHDKTKHVPGAGGVELFENYSDWIDAKKDLEHIERVPVDKVPASQYIAINTDGKVVGFIQLRHSLNEYLLNEGGHIGYSVRPSERRKGYATQMLRLCLVEARLLGIKNILVTCDVDNTGSEKTAVANGGVFENIFDSGNGPSKKRFWIST